MKNRYVLNQTYTSSFIFFISLLFSVLHHQTVKAQICDDDVYLLSQSEVDTCSCVEITGWLYISGSDITNLDGLSSLTTVSGDLYIYDNPVLTSVSGLSSLTSVNGFGGMGMIIEYNPMLTNLDGLVSLTTVGSPYGGGLHIKNNLILADIDGLGSMSTLGGEESYGLSIENNPALINLDGLAAVTSFGGGIGIINNGSLTNIDGLSNISGVWDGSLRIKDNSTLTNVDGLASLVNVAGFVVIENNASLTNLDGLTSLTNIYGFWSGDLLSLIIRDNPLLTNLDGLAGLTNLAGHLDIQNNIVLDRFCGLYPLLKDGEYEISFTYTVGGNALNPTIADIIVGGYCSDFILINALTDKDIGYLNDGDILDLANLPTDQLAIRANLEGPGVASVRFSFQNVAKFRIENFAPYALHGDSNGDYNAYNYTPGTYTVSATPYNRRNGKGTKGLKRTVNFTVIDSNAGARKAAGFFARVYPNPTSSKFTVDLQNLEEGNVRIQLYNLSGQIILEKNTEITQMNFSQALNASDFPSGIYILKITNGNQTIQERLMKL